MNEDQNQQKNLVDTTDCLEAIGVFRWWKNFLFVIVILCLLLLQVSFWLVNTGHVKAEEKTKAAAAETTLPAITPPPAKEPVVPPKEKQIKQWVEKPNKIENAAKQVAAEPNQPTEAAPQQQTSPLFGITFKHLSWLIRFVNFVLIPTAILYCLTILFSLKVSLMGRLGGINHISRAFFLSLAFLVLLLPWQRFFGGVVAGAMYTPSELVRWYTVETTGGIFGIIFYYLRFTGYWLLVLLLLIFAQLRSARWAKATIRRLEVV